jgi:hypothetical protein
MPSDPLTLDAWDALDDQAKDAAMATALGWWTLEASPGIWQRGKVLRNVVAPYFTGGDADPFANWNLLAEVWGLLLTTPDGVTWHLEQSLVGATDTLSFAMLGSDYWEDDAIWIEGYGKSPHRAACRAAVAAGLVPDATKENDDEGDREVEV